MTTVQLPFDFTPSFEPIKTLEDLFNEFQQLKNQKSRITHVYNNEPFYFNAVTITGRVVYIQIRPTNTVLHIKQEIYKQDQIPLDQQRLVYNGATLDDERTIQECGIIPDARIYLVLRLRGGMFHNTSSRSDYQTLTYECKEMLDRGLSMLRFMESKYNIPMKKIKDKLIGFTTEKELSDMVKTIDYYYMN